MKFRIAAGVVLVGILGAGAYLGGAVLDGSAGGGWSHQAGEGWDAERVMVRTFELGVPNLVLLVEPVTGDLDDPEVAAAVAAMSADLASYTGITQLDSYWSLGGPESYASEDGSIGLVTARIGGSEGGLAGRADTVLRSLDYDPSVIQVTSGGSAVVQRDARQETLGSVVPLAIAFLLSIGLVLLFLRNLAATGFVALTSAVAVAVTIIALWGLERLVTVPTPAVLIAVAMAWGCATSGGFVFGHRFVAERRAGAGRTAAVVATVGSAGRTVTIANAVIASVVLILWLMPTAIIRSTAYASTIAVLAAGVASVLVLGLLLSSFGAGMATGDGLRQPAARPGFTDRIAAFASARPVVTLVVSIVVLGGVSLVGLVGLNTGETTAESLPEATASRQVAGTLSGSFAVDEVDGPFVIGPNIEFGDAPAQLAEYTASLSTIDDVGRADSAEGSYAAGVAVATPEPLTARLDSDRANLVRAPLSVPADSIEAQGALEQIEEVAAPFRADIGGTTVRHVTTAAAVDARVPFLVVGAVLAILLLSAWLLHGWRMALRLAVAAVLSASGAVLVVRLGFVEGMLTDLLGSSQVVTLDAFAAPLAWAVGLALVAGWLALGWGTAREAFDVTEGSSRGVIRSLAATRNTQLGAGALLWLPFLALAFTGWRTQQMIAVAVVGAGVLAVTAGRFVVTPALFAVAPGRLWPRKVDGSVDAVYPTTAAAAWLVGAVEQVIPAGAPATAAPAEEPAVAPAEEPAAPTEEPSAPEEPGIEAVAAAAVVTAAMPDAADDVAAVPDDTSVRRRRRARWRRAGQEAMISEETVEPEPVAVAEVEPEPVAVVEETVEPESVAVVEEAVEPDPVAAAEVEEPVAPEPVAVVEVEETVEPEPVAVVEVEETVEPEPVAVAEVEDVAEPEPVAVAEVEDVAEPEPAAVVDEVVAPRPVAVVAMVEEDVADTAVDEAEPTGPVDQAADETEPVAAVEPAEVEIDVPVPGPVAAVDVISLTESVIASIEADTPFTTEISSGFVANPSNNLSRVMEAILRDASRRGGEEVLVYGHASAGRYRWMVVDSGPRADHDPERARTLAEAQRFIRRVGGVVECRPEGDFTVFVVEIPMAS
jgi:putative drug exporter of the RND superfamily